MKASEKAKTKTRANDYKTNDKANDNPNNVNILADLENIASSDSQEVAQNFA